MSGDVRATPVRSTPVLLVHGIWDDGARMATMQRGLERAGLGPVVAIDLVPSDGSAPIATLAAQVDARIAALCRETGAPRVDLVGFSMGALVSRYVVQRLGGKASVRRLVAISGPMAGTLHAYALPLAGARDMRPGSALLADLARDEDPWGPVEVHVVHTPLDITIVPARSSLLRGAASTRAIPVWLHRFVITDARVIAHVAALLRA